MRTQPVTILFVLLSALRISDGFSQDQSAFRVERLSFNTGTFSEIAPVLVNDGIIFCSDRRTSGIVYRTSFDNRRLYNLYLVQRIDSSGWHKPVMVSSERSQLFNSGPLTIAPDGKTVYFTSEIETGDPSRNRKFTNRSGIFTGIITGTSLTSIQPLKFNNPAYNTGQPSISPDGKYLFFASDMPGGQGGSDIFYCEQVNGEWSDPVNAGTGINSPGRENYPFIHTSGKLYFASDRPGGIGGLDVWQTSKINGSWDSPVPLSEPVNSTLDDFAFAASPDLRQGYFSSNRDRNDDIYQFVMTIVRKSSCNPLEENNYCYEFVEENAIKYDSIPFRYEWKFGDGNTSAGPRVEHCYEGPGTYTVQLDVVNLVTKEILVNEKTEILIVEDIVQPYISCPDISNPGRAISCSADSTNLPGWDISRYYWNFGDETFAIGKNVGKVYLKPGNYNIQLIITADPGPDGKPREACVSKDIIIKPQP